MMASVVAAALPAPGSPVTRLGSPLSLACLLTLIAVPVWAASPEIPTEPVASSVASSFLSGETVTRLAFAPGVTELSEPTRQQLTAIAEILRSDATLIAHIKAYAGSGGESAEKAKRISLMRAIAVRSWLLRNGFGDDRLQVWALGHGEASTPADRVDISLVFRQ